MTTRTRNSGCFSLLQHLRGWRLALLVLFLLGSASLAQLPMESSFEDGPRLTFSYDGQTPIGPTRGLALRPNQEQPVFVHVENPSPLKKRVLLRLMLPGERKGPVARVLPPGSPASSPPEPVEFARARSTWHREKRLSSRSGNWRANLSR